MIALLISAMQVSSLPEKQSALSLEETVVVGNPTVPSYHARVNGKKYKAMKAVLFEDLSERRTRDDTKRDDGDSSKACVKETISRDNLHVVGKVRPARLGIEESVIARQESQATSLAPHKVAKLRKQMQAHYLPSH